MSVATPSAVCALLRELKAERAPRGASNFGVAAQTPRPPPVTRATLFSSAISIFLPLLALFLAFPVPQMLAKKAKAPGAVCHYGRDTSDETLQIFNKRLSLGTG